MSIITMFKLIPLGQLFRNSSHRVDNVMIHDALKISGIYREIHGANSVSPIGTEHHFKILNSPAASWYANIYEKNNLLVLNGSRDLDLWCMKKDKMINFKLTEDKIYRNGKLYYGSPALISWGGDIFHKTKSGSEGSISINFTEKNYVIEEIYEELWVKENAFVP